MKTKLNIYFKTQTLQEILQSDEFLQLPIELLCEILRDDELDVNEERIWNAALRWVKFDLENRRAEFSKV